MAAAGRTAGRARALGARECALRVIRRVFEHGAYADRAFTGEAAELEPRERSLAMALAYGTIQRRATLDHFAARLSSRPLERLEPAVLAALRLGLVQLLYMDGIADHAAVNETVALAKRVSRGGGGLVNAVLRRAAAERKALLASLDDSTPEGAAIMHSVPGWLAARWWEELGAEEARALLAAVNRPAESALRVNTLTASVEAVADALPVPARGAAELPEGLVLKAPWDAHGSELWRSGALMPQSRGSMLVARTVAPEPGDRALDLCAAPGGKTTHLAALMEDQGVVVAVERHPGRARALAATCARMGAGCVRVEPGDASVPRAGRTVRPGAGRPAVQRSRDAPVAPRPALAGRAGVDPAARRAPGADSRRRRHRDPPRRGPRLLGLHDLALRELRSDRPVSGAPTGLGARGGTATAPAPGRDRRVLHRAVAAAG